MYAASRIAHAVASRGPVYFHTDGQAIELARSLSAMPTIRPMLPMRISNSCLNIYQDSGVCPHFIFVLTVFVFLPNVKAEPCVCLARIVPSRSEEKARFVTSIRIGSSALLGLFFCL